MKTKIKRRSPYEENTIKTLFRWERFILLTKKEKEAVYLLLSKKEMIVKDIAEELGLSQQAGRSVIFRVATKLQKSIDYVKKDNKKFTYCSLNPSFEEYLILRGQFKT